MKCSSTYLVGMREAKAVAKLMSSRLEQVCSFQAVDRPRLGIVKVCIATVDREICMSEGASDPIKRVAVPVHPTLEPDVNVHLAEQPLLEG